MAKKEDGRDVFETALDIPGSVKNERDYNKKLDKFITEHEVEAWAKNAVKYGLGGLVAGGVGGHVLAKLLKRSRVKAARRDPGDFADKARVIGGSAGAVVGGVGGAYLGPPRSKRKRK